MQLEPPASRDAETLAEWAETILVVEELASITRVAIRQRFQQGQQPDDVELGMLFSEVGRRGGLADELYPFKVDPDGVEIRRRDDFDATVYDFLLVVSLERAPFRLQNRFADMNPPLDLLAREALRVYLGEGAVATRFSWPTSDGRPESFPEAVTWLADAMNLPELSKKRNPDRKDGALDIAAWRPFRDGRPGFAVVLAQVTCEMTFEEKAARIPVNQWKGWIEFGSTPSTALVVPFAIPIADDRWGTLRNADQVVVERVRLCELLAGVDLTTYDEWESMKTFVEDERQALAAQIEAVAHIARPKKPVRQAHAMARAAAVTMQVPGQSGAAAARGT
jgi:hypothetical protein